MQAAPVLYDLNLLSACIILLPTVCLSGLSSTACSLPNLCQHFCSPPYTLLFTAASELFTAASELFTSTSSREFCLTGRQHLE
jgi:hypothetical protein